MIIDDLIFDRTAADVVRVAELKRKIASYEGIGSLTVEELAEYMGGMKGAYNYTDMNRVGQAVAYLAPIASAFATTIETYRTSKGVAQNEIIDPGFVAADVSITTPKTDWAVTDTPTKTQADAYMANINNLYGCLISLLTRWGHWIEALPPYLDWLDYNRANDIEKTLYWGYYTMQEAEPVLKDYIDKCALGFMYSDELYCGEV